MLTSWELEARAREADATGDETRADHLYAMASEAREVEDDMLMAIPRAERYDHEGRIEKGRHWRV